MGKIVITGAAGNIGTKLRAHLADRWAMVLIDRKGGDGIFASDLGIYHDAWVNCFVGADAVIDLAAVGDPQASRESCSNSEKSATNVRRAMREHNVARLIFSSSNWVMAGYRDGNERISTDLPPKPVNDYGKSKLAVESAGASFARETRATFIALRIGYCGNTPGNLPGPHMAMGHWGQQMWLSDRDLCNGFERALTADISGAHILNLMSDNPGMRWDIEKTRQVIGYTPRDGHRTI